MPDRCRARLYPCACRAFVFCTSPSWASTSLCSRSRNLVYNFAAFTTRRIYLSCRNRFAFFLNFRGALRNVFALIDPALYADHAVSGVGAGHAEIDVGAQGLQRQAALQIPFLAGDFRAVQAAGHANLDAFAAEAQSGVHRFAHGAAKSHALFKLQRDGFGDQLRVQLRAMHFLNVDVHFTLGTLLHVLLELVDLRAFAADDDAGARGIDAHDQLVSGALDVDGADARALQLFLELGAQLHVFVEQLGVVAIGVPARLPRFVVAQSKSVRVCLLSHAYPLRPRPKTNSIARVVITSCPFSDSGPACRSRLCEPGARCRVLPFALPFRLRWLPRVGLRRHDARPRPPTGARCASGSGMRGPSARDEYASSACLR